MKHELAELIADARAALQSQIARGVRGEAVDAPAPAVVPFDDGLAFSVDPPSEEVPARWTSLAARAREADSEQSTLASVRQVLGDCRRCGLAGRRTQIVFGVGDEAADLLLVGEAPGQNEDREGEPFVGDAGQMLDRMLKGVFGLERREVYICNVVKCRPPDDRAPSAAESETCVPFLHQQIAIVQPKVIVVLGARALTSLFGARDGVRRDRGGWCEYQGIPTMPTFHPNDLLRDPSGRRDTFNDLKSALKRYDALGGKRMGERPKF